MKNSDLIAIASRWSAAMSSKNVTPLKALAEVLDDDVRTATLVGKDAVLNWFKTWPGMTMFRTGTWEEPTVAGDTVTFVNRFDPKAAYYSAKVSITVSPEGRITRSTSTVIAGPEPLGGVIHRVWGPRAGMDRLPQHLTAAYGVKVRKIAQLQQGNHGVWRVDVDKGGPWVVRVFPSDRPVSDVEGDAAVLRFLEAQEYPSERVAADVSEHEGQGVLVTQFIKGQTPKPSTAIQGELGDLLGRLQTLKGAPKAAKRDAGGLHLYTVDCTVRSEINTGRASLDAAAFRGTDRAWDTLRAGLEAADDFSSLPKALMHPDPATVNAVSQNGRLVLIDWTGAGYGPRVLGLGLLLLACTRGKTFNREWVDAIMDAYAQHVKLTAAEFERLEGAIAHRALIHETYSWAAGMAMQRKPASRKDWPHNNEGISKLAAYIREEWS